MNSLPVGPSITATAFSDTPFGLLQTKSNTEHSGRVTVGQGEEWIMLIRIRLVDRSRMLVLAFMMDESEVWPGLAWFGGQILYFTPSFGNRLYLTAHSCMTPIWSVCDIN